MGTRKDRVRTYPYRVKYINPRNYVAPDADVPVYSFHINVRNSNEAKSRARASLGYVIILSADRDPHNWDVAVEQKFLSARQRKIVERALIPRRPTDDLDAELGATPADVDFANRTPQYLVDAAVEAVMEEIEPIQCREEDDDLVASPTLQAAASAFAMPSGFYSFTGFTPTIPMVAPPTLSSALNIAPAATVPEPPSPARLQPPIDYSKCNCGNRHQPVRFAPKPRQLKRSSLGGVIAFVKAFLGAL